MLRIVYKTFIFSIPVLLFFYGANKWVDYCINNKKYYQVGEEKKILLVGNSQSERGLMDDVIQNSVNLSQSGDCYFYNYYKIKKIVTENPQIGYVVLVYTNNFFIKETDKWIYDEGHLGYKYPKYSHTVSAGDKCLLFSKNPGPFLIASRDAFRTNAQLAVHPAKSIYKKLDWGSLKLGEGVIDSLLPTKPLGAFYADTCVPALDILYLTEIADFCKQNHKKLILVRLPMPKSFPKINEQELQQFYTEKLNTIEFWEYGNSFNQYDKFMDSQHLNSTGAKEISEEINSRLKKEFPDLN